MSVTAMNISPAEELRSQARYSDPSLVIRPAWIDPPAEAQPFDVQGSIVMPAVVPGTFVPILSFTVPRSRYGIIKKYATEVVGGGFTEGSGELIWQIAHDNRPFRYYNKILFSLGDVNDPTAHPLGLHVLENQVITISVQNTAIVPAGQNVEARAMGWFYPKKFAPTNTNLPQ